jgi:hypothetical protein
MFSKDLLAIFTSWFCPAFWWREGSIYLVFSAFTSRPTFLLASIKVSAFYGILVFMVLMVFWYFFRNCHERTCPIQTSYIPRTKSHVHFPRPFVTLRNKLIFYGEELLAPLPTPKLEDYHLSAVRGCLFNIFAVTLHIWKPSPPSATWGRAMPWWQGTHLTWTT